jgi:CBS-domain-containing membrane protein
MTNSILTSRLPAVSTDTPSRLALQTMDAADADALPVLDRTGARCVGLVLRGGLERGCVAMKHDADTCTVLNHLKRDVAFVREGDELRGIRNKPVVVLDSDGAPVRVAIEA